MKALILALACLSAPATARAESAQARAGQIFDLGTSARPYGMGGAWTAVPREPFSLLLNPAGLGLVDGRHLSLTRASLFGGVTYDGLGYSQGLKSRPGGWSAQFVRLAGSGDGRDEANVSAGGFSYAETGLALGTGMRTSFFPNVSLGVGLKALNRTLGSSSDRLYGLDAGLQYGPVFDRLTIGGVARNAYSKSQGDTSDKLPTRLVLGASYRLLEGMLLAVDVGSDGEFVLGTQYTIGVFALRAGMAGTGLTMGGGMKLWKGFSMDLAVVTNSALGMSQRLSVGYRFGAASSKRRLETFVGDYIDEARLALAERDYLRAVQRIEGALGLEPAKVTSEWRQRAKALRRLVDALELESRPLEAAELKHDAQAALLGYRAIMAFIDGDESGAILLAHVASGAAGGSGVFQRLLQAIAAQTRQPVVREDIVAPDVFVRERLRRALDGLYGKRVDASLRACREAIIIEPTNALAWTRLGSVYFASGDRQQARLAYQRALELNPSDTKLADFVKENLP